MVHNPEDAHKMAKEMLGKSLVTIQSGKDGLPCNAVYLVEKINIDKEFYLSLTLDRQAGCPTFIYSPEGGMAIEDVAHSNPEKIFKMRVDPLGGLDAAKLKQAALDLGIPELTE